MAAKKQSNAIDRSNMSATFKEAFGIGMTEAQYNDGAKFVSISLDDDNENSAAKVAENEHQATITRSRYLENAAIGEEMRQIREQERIKAARKAEEARQTRMRATLAARAGMPVRARSPTPFPATIPPRVTSYSGPRNFASKPACDPNDLAVPESLSVEELSAVPRSLEGVFPDIPTEAFEDIDFDIDRPSNYTTRPEPVALTPAGGSNFNRARRDSFMDIDSDEDSLFVRQTANITPPSSFGSSIGNDVSMDGPPTATIDDLMLTLQTLTNAIQALEQQNRNFKATILTEVMNLSYIWESNMKLVASLKKEWEKFRPNVLADFRQMTRIVNSIYAEENASLIPLNTMFANLHGPSAPASGPVNTTSPSDDNVPHVDE